jgi:hypothetical protein
VRLGVTDWREAMPSPSGAGWPVTRPPPGIATSGGLMIGVKASIPAWQR